MIREFKPDRSDQPSQNQLRFVRSDDKNRSIWQYLKRYQNPSFVETRLRIVAPTMNNDLLAKKAKHIADCIRQSEAYFDTASKSSLSIKPLILYYGMLNLAKALMLLGDNLLTLQDDVLKSEGFNDHGLTHSTKRNTSDASIRDDEANLLDEFCYTKGAEKTVFGLLHQCWFKDVPGADKKFTIGDLASMHPSSWKSYADYTNNEPKYFPAEGNFRTTSDGYEHFLMFRGEFQFLTYVTASPTGTAGNDFFEYRMPKLARLYNRSDAYSPYAYRSKQPPLSADEYQAIYRASTGESYTMADASNGLSLHPLEVEFVMMFILGSLTRYAPQKWLKNVEYEGGDSMFVIEGFINAAQLSFPKMILEELDARDYTFTGDSAYWA